MDVFDEISSKINICPSSEQISEEMEITIRAYRSRRSIFLEKVNEYKQKQLSL